MTALPACSPTGGFSGIHTGSRIPGLHTTMSAHVRLPDPVVLPEDWGCSGPDARSTTWGLDEVHGCARRRRERRRNKSGERWKGRGSMMSLSQEDLGVTGGDTRWVRGLSWGTEETVGCNRYRYSSCLPYFCLILHFTQRSTWFWSSTLAQAEIFQQLLDGFLCFLFVCLFVLQISWSPEKEL